MVYAKLDWLLKAGIINLLTEQAAQIQVKEFSHASMDLYESIENGGYPEWDLFVQMLEFNCHHDYDFNLFDPTKERLEDLFPYEFVGAMLLKCHPENAFSETESIDFNPGLLIPGTLPLEDRLHQGDS